MLRLDFAEFYITHHCNIDCKNCNRFNNYNFKGHIDWRLNENEYEQWSKNLQIKHIGILGGEPLMHPDVNGWIKKIRSWWPDSKLVVTTNGRLLNKVSGLYDTVKEAKCTIEICVHNYDWIKGQIEDLKNFFPGQFELHDDIDDACFFTKTARDSNGVTVLIKKYNAMHQSTLSLSHNRLKLHNSDPIKSHKICDMKGCHTFIDGTIYKCPLPPLLLEFSDQYLIDINDEDTKIVKNFSGFSVSDAVNDSTKFFSYLQNPIDHCRFCPEKYKYEDIQSSLGKTKIPIYLKK
jgi:organic radical activating enzyme